MLKKFIKRKREVKKVMKKKEDSFIQKLLNIVKAKKDSEEVKKLKDIKKKIKKVQK